MRGWASKNEVLRIKIGAMLCGRVVEVGRAEGKKGDCVVQKFRDFIRFRMCRTRCVRLLVHVSGRMLARSLKSGRKTGRGVTCE